MGKVVKLLYCDLCKKPISKKGLRKIDFMDIPLCDSCYKKYLNYSH